MSEEILIRQGAPTLAGIKTGSLFPCACACRAALLTEIRRINRTLTPKGLCLLPIRFLEGQALLYLYRPAASEPRSSGFAGGGASAPGRISRGRLRKMSGAAHPPLPRERRVPARGRTVPQLSARGCARLYRAPGRRLQMHRALKVYGDEANAKKAFCPIPQMHAELLRALAGRLRYGAAGRRSLIAYFRKE